LVDINPEGFYGRKQNQITNEKTNGIWKGILEKSQRFFPSGVLDSFIREISPVW
jgi:hypothetical protein